MAATLRAEWSPSFLQRLRSMGRVLVALMLRETKTRFGRSRFGYVWAIVEPIVYITFFLTIRTFIARGAGAFGESLMLFLMTGLITVRVFLAVSSFTSAAILSNRALLAYPPVKPIDVVVSRFLLESLTMLFVVVVFYSALAIVDERNVVPNHVAFAFGLSATFLLAAGVGMFNAVVSVLVPTWQRVWALLRLPLFILSGIFYLPSELPPQAQAVLWWNPVLHCVEWVRTGTYVTYDPLLDTYYPLSFGALFLVGGLTLERVYRFRVLSA